MSHGNTVDAATAAAAAATAATAPGSEVAARAPMPVRAAQSAGTPALAARAFPAFRSFPAELVLHVNRQTAVEGLPTARDLQAGSAATHELVSDGSDWGAQSGDGGSSGDGGGRRRRDGHSKPVSSSMSSSAPGKKHKSKSSKRKESSRRSRERSRERSDPLADAYVINKRGDISNAMYESIRNTAIPLYKRYGARVLGETRDLVLRRVHGRVVLGKPPGAAMLLGAGMTAKERYAVFRQALRPRAMRVAARGPHAAPSKTASATAAVSSAPLSSDFIALDDAPKRRGGLGFGRDDDDDEDDKAAAAAAAASSQLDLSAFEQDMEFQAKSKEADQAVRKNPKNVGAWLAFVKLQDTLMENVPAARRSAMQRIVNDKKMAILERGISYLPDHERLLAAYMDCWGETVDTHAQLERWDELLQENPTSYLLWTKYLDFRQSTFGAFTVTQCIQVFEECIEALRDEAGQDSNSGSSSESRGGAAAPPREASGRRVAVEAQMLHVFTRACVMLAQAGYTERAVAACQAMVEFNCFAPAAFARQTFKQRVSLFEDFWETECARFGEDGACGWSNSLFDDGNDAAGAEMEGMTADDIDGEGAPNLHRLYQREILGQRESWRPLRGSTDEDQQDPFRTVLFDDIRGLMFEAQCLQTKRGLVFLLLRLLGTSFNACVGSSHAGMVDPFICGGEAMGAAAERAGRILAIRTSAESAMMPGADGATRSLAFPFRAFPQSVWTLLADGVRWVPLFGLDDAQSMDAAGRGMRAMAGLAIQQCRPVLGQDPWLLPMLLAMEAPVGQKSVEKMAKALLKTERTDLPLWSAYAQVLMRAGKWDEARRVYLTAIASSRAFPKDARAGSAQLYTLLADLEITQGQPKAAVNVLISAADDAALSEDYMSTEPQPTRLLKTRKHFAQRVSQILRVTDPNTYSPDMAELLDAAYASAMLEHLTQGVDAGNAQFEMLVGQCQAHAVEVQQLMGDDGGADGAGGGGTQPASLLEEYVLEMWARHLFLRSTSGEAFKPAALRDVLERAIQRFPGNTLFLVLYGWNEARVGFENRVRRFLGEQFDRTRRPATLLFSVWSEMHQRTGTNTNAVRALLQKALDDAGMRHSPVVWLLAIELEMRTGGTERAKALFFQAIRACPWSKELYLLPFGPLAELFSDKELEEVYALMEDKEIRVRFPLE